MKKIALFLAGCSFVAAAPAQLPYDWVAESAPIVRIEVTYMPSIVLFSTDVSLGNCPAGTFLRWMGSGPDEATRQANVKAVLASLLAMKLSGNTVRLYGANANCEVKFIHLN
jgi:hypothetical protein